MAEEFQAEVCGGSWWSPPTFISSCWLQNDFMNIKTRSTDEFSGGCATAISPDSTSQIIMGSSPSTTTNWYQALFVNGRTGESCSQTLPEILTSFPDGGRNSLNIDMDDQEQPSNFITTSGDCNGNVVTTSYDYSSSLLQTFLDGTSSSPTPAPPPAPKQQIYDIQPNLNEFDPVSSMTRFSSTNKTFLWNDLSDNEAYFFSSAYEEKPKCPNITLRNEENHDGLGSSVKKGSSESPFKRPRLETPSPLPTFKVRKEKLGDRVTALQQLVSPFGKTDTASVLHEAIDYIKHLHDQVNILSNPYMKNGAPMQVQKINEKMEDNNEGSKQQDLRSRGLCLVPVSSTFPVATETTPDYWTSGFRSTFN